MGGGGFWCTSASGGGCDGGPAAAGSEGGSAAQFSTQRTAGALTGAMMQGVRAPMLLSWMASVRRLRKDPLLRAALKAAAAATGSPPGNTITAPAELFDSHVTANCTVVPMLSAAQAPAAGPSSRRCGPPLPSAGMTASSSMPPLEVSVHDEICACRAIAPSTLRAGDLAVSSHAQP